MTGADFSNFDYIIAMDHKNVQDLTAMAPQEEVHKISLLMSFAQEDATGEGAASEGPREIPDPYGLEIKAYRHTLKLCEAGVRGLMAHIRQNDPKIHLD